jgi:hypothetical protein
MKNIEIYWEQDGFNIEIAKENSLSMLDLLEQLDLKGRKSLISLLTTNYRDELKKEFDRITNFERRHFGRT